ncbi:hypothetical protein LY76DRAFT_144268 [Colletotrichum caudatum]|nr:hypothetical protein LY76DRAFT_144268 [Colletotrichum caudatum]
MRWDRALKVFENSGDNCIISMRGTSRMMFLAISRMSIGGRPSQATMLVNPLCCFLILRATGPSNVIGSSMVTVGRKLDDARALVSASMFWSTALDNMTLSLAFAPGILTTQDLTGFVTLLTYDAGRCRMVSIHFFLSPDGCRWETIELSLSIRSSKLIESSARISAIASTQAR